eukprot:TRINITY_DN18820_c0_g1_i1.p1 TRINITY_DN18820_c0_g1~~TRINITY_DN18820_c0_g1_i1.p1  ORF type:complete len:949 (+),score=193.02 TRINITY_DN18820_c0_g1_i1:88-2847(+)
MAWLGRGHRDAARPDGQTPLMPSKGPATECREGAVARQGGCASQAGAPGIGKYFGTILWCQTAESASNPSSFGCTTFHECCARLEADGHRRRVLHFTSPIALLREALKNDAAAIVVDTSLFEPCGGGQPSRGHRLLSDLCSVSGATEVFVPVPEEQPPSFPPPPQASPAAVAAAAAALTAACSVPDDRGQWNFRSPLDTWVPLRVEDDVEVETGFRKFLSGCGNKHVTQKMSFAHGAEYSYTFQTLCDGSSVAAEYCCARGRHRNLIRRRRRSVPAVCGESILAHFPCVRVVQPQRLPSALLKCKPQTVCCAAAGAAGGERCCGEPPRVAGIVLGDLWVRAGQLRNVRPSSAFYNSVSYSRDRVLVGVADDDDDAVAYVSRNVLRYGHLQDRQAKARLSSVLACAFNEVGVVDADTVIVSEPSHGSDAHRAILLRELLFGGPRLSGVYMASREVLALYSRGHTNGLVVNLGDQHTTAVPIVDGVPVLSAVQVHQSGMDQLRRALDDRLACRNRGRNGWGGRSITQAVDNYMQRDLHVLPKAKMDEFFRISREVFDYAAPAADGQEIFLSNASPDDLSLFADRLFEIGIDICGDVPLDQQDTEASVNVCGGSELWEISEVLFNPHLPQLLFPDGFPKSFNRDHFGRTLPYKHSRQHLLPPPGWRTLPDLVRAAVDATPARLRPRVCNAVVLSGGGASLRGLGDRLSEELWSTPPIDDAGVWRASAGGETWQLDRHDSAQLDRCIRQPREAHRAAPAVEALRIGQHTKLYALNLPEDAAGHAEARCVVSGDVVRIHREDPDELHPVSVPLSLPPDVQCIVLDFIGPLSYANQLHRVEVPEFGGSLAFRGMAMLVAHCRTLHHRTVSRADVLRGEPEEVLAVLSQRCPDRGIAPLLFPDAAWLVPPLAADVVNMPCVRRLHR